MGELLDPDPPGSKKSPKVSKTVIKMVKTLYLNLRFISSNQILKN